MTDPTPVKIALLGIGLDTYWAQFAGLEARLLGYIDIVADRVSQRDAEVLNLGMVDTVDKAFAAGRAVHSSGAGLLLIYATTYALSSTVLPIVRRLNVPVVILNLQPGCAIDYAAFNRDGDRTRMTGEWLAWCASCPVPEIANVLRRAKLPFHQVTGTLEQDDPCWADISAWVDAARVAEALSVSRLGLLGHYYNGMLDIYTDLTRLQITFGGHFEILEMDELAACRAEVREADAHLRVAEFREHFVIEPSVPASELARAARTSLALDLLVARHRLDAMAYYYESVPGHVHEDIIGSVILGSSMLIDRGVPVAGEYEVKNALAMKIMSLLGAGGSFSEYYALDLADNVVLLGHDGPGHIGIAENKTSVRALDVYHGKPSSGLGIEMSVRKGPVTLLSVVEAPEGGFFLLYAHGECVSGPTLAIVNTNSRYRFAPGARAFVEAWNAAGPAHHCAIGVGHVGDRLERLGAVIGVTSVKVC